MSKLVRRVAARTLPFVLLIAAAAPDPACVPRLVTAALAEPSFITGPALSPAGQRILARVAANGGVSLGVTKLTGTDLELVTIADGRSRWRHPLGPGVTRA